LVPTIPRGIGNGVRKDLSLKYNMDKDVIAPIE
jgi:hypothetical protein